MTRPFSVDAQDAGLFVVLVVLLGSAFAIPADPPSIVDTFYLALFVHVGFTLYGGAFPPWRTLTWLVLIAAWVGAELVAFAGYVLPLGQFAYWLAGIPLIGGLMRWPPLAWPLAGMVLLCLDLVAANRGRWKTRSGRCLAIFAIAALATAAMLAWASSALLPVVARPDAQLALRIIPDWYTLPFYAILRSVPWKLAGVVLTFASALLPIVWPWASADALRRGPLGRLWLLACLMLGAAWIGLAILGGRPAEDMVVLASQILAAFYFAFFLVLMPLLHRLARSPSNA